MDINSLIANYLKNTSNNEVSASQIKDTFYSLANEDLQNYDSIFVYGEDATKDELIEYMSRACGKDDAQFKEDVGLLFDVLNSNSDDDVLTAEELEEFTRERGENKGKINGYGIWNQLLETDVSDIENEIADYELGELAQDILESGDVEGELATYAAIYGEDSAEYKAIEEQVELAQSDSADSADSADGEGRSEEDINRMAQSIVDGKTTLEKIKSKGILTDEEIAQFEEAIKTLQTEGETPSTTPEATTPEATTPEATTPEATTPEATTPEATTPEATTPEATTPEASTPEATTPEATYPESTTPEATQMSERDIFLNQLASNLHDAMKGGLFGWGTDDEAFASIMNNSDLTSDDWVKIIASYNENHGSFIQDVDGDFTGDVQDKYQAKIADVLIEAAKNGNEQAIELLCQEIHNGTAGQMGTADEFIAEVFAKADDEVLAQIINHYEGDIISDIKGDFSGETEDKYVAQINNAIIKALKNLDEEET